MIGDHFCWKEIIMQLKLTTEYAIRIALYLAEQNGVCTSKEIAEYTQISPNYVLKILRVLAKASLVQNHIGVYGGFSLCKHPRDITLLDIVSSTESIVWNKMQKNRKKDTKRFVPCTIFIMIYRTKLRNAFLTKHWNSY